MWISNYPSNICLTVSVSINPIGNSNTCYIVRTTALCTLNLLCHHNETLQNIAYITENYQFSLENPIDQLSAILQLYIHRHLQNQNNFSLKSFFQCLTKKMILCHSHSMCFPVLSAE